MRTNELLLTLHILAAATWIGAALALQVIAARQRPSTPDTVVDEFAIDSEAVGKMLFAPAAIVLLVTGVAGAGEGRWISPAHNPGREPPRGPRSRHIARALRATSTLARLS